MACMVLPMILGWGLSGIVFLLLMNLFIQFYYLITVACFRVTGTLSGTVPYHDYFHIDILVLPVIVFDNIKGMGCSLVSDDAGRECIPLIQTSGDLGIETSYSCFSPLMTTLSH